MLKIFFFIITVLLITYIIKNNNTIENMDNINDYGTFQPFIDDGNFFVFDLDELLSSLKSTAEINNSIDVFQSQEWIYSLNIHAPI